MLTRRPIASGRRLPPVRRGALATVALALLSGCGHGAPPLRVASPVAEPQLRELDGVYAAEITRASLRHLRLPASTPAGVWKIAIHVQARTIEVSAPEGPDSGGYTLAIAHMAPGRLTLTSDRTCEIPSERNRPADVAYSLRRSSLVFTQARGGCTSAWLLLRSTTWLQA